MKSKAKLQKIKATKNSEAAKGPKLPNGWILMVPGKVTVSDLRTAFDADQDIEVWPEAGIMEIVMSEKSSIDIETLPLSDFADEYSRNFLETNRIQSIFYVNFRAEDYELAKKFLKQLSEKTGGFVCGDTEDFQPRLS